MAHFLSVLSLDFGAESGRAVQARFVDGRLELEEIHRFRNEPVRVGDTVHWDVLRLWHETKAALVKASSLGPLASIGVDTWGVDFALLDRNGKLLGNPTHYRDRRTDGMMESAFAVVPRERIFEQTGIQFMQINTLYQLLSMTLSRSVELEAAHTLLTMPDLFNYWLTGSTLSEFTIATTTQCCSPIGRDWARGMLSELGIRADIFAPIIPPATRIGPMTSSLAAELGVTGVEVVAPACHDTGSAVAGIPCRGEGFGYISSGTWSLAGVEVTQPVIDARSLTCNFTNEGGAGDTFRLLRNIMGLWLVQECRRRWQRDGDNTDYPALTAMAERAQPFQAFIDPDDSRFLAPEDMPREIERYCSDTGQTPLTEKGAIVRCCLESLAFTYRRVMERLRDLAGYIPTPIHIVGGGCRNELLCQFAANAIGEPVVAGPAEATAAGNALLQLVGLGELDTLAEAREVSRRSFVITKYQPQDTQRWDEAYQRFLRFTGG